MVIDFTTLCNGRLSTGSQKRDSFNLVPGLDMLGAQNSNHPEAFFPETVPFKPYLEPLVWELPDDIKFWIL